MGVIFLFESSAPYAAPVLVMVLHNIAFFRRTIADTETFSDVLLPAGIVIGAVVVKSTDEE